MIRASSLFEQSEVQMYNFVFINLKFYLRYAICAFKPFTFMKKIVLFMILALCGCKKSETPKNYRTLTIAVTGVAANGTYSIDCIDTETQTQSYTPPPFFSINKSAENKTYTTQVYSGESVLFNITNTVPGAIATLSVDGAVLLKTQKADSSAGYAVNIP